MIYDYSVVFDVCSVLIELSDCKKVDQVQARLPDGARAQNPYLRGLVVGFAQLLAQM